MAGAARPVLRMGCRNDVAANPSERGGAGVRALSCPLSYDARLGQSQRRRSALRMVRPRLLQPGTPLTVGGAHPHSHERGPLPVHLRTSLLASRRGPVHRRCGSFHRLRQTACRRGRKRSPGPVTMVWPASGRSWCPQNTTHCGGTAAPEGARQLERSPYGARAKSLSAAATSVRSLPRRGSLLLSSWAGSRRGAERSAPAWQTLADPKRHVVPRAGSAGPYPARPWWLSLPGPSVATSDFPFRPKRGASYRVSPALRGHPAHDRSKEVRGSGVSRSSQSLPSSTASGPSTPRSREAMVFGARAFVHRALRLAHQGVTALASHPP